MTFADGWSALNLETPSRVPRVEFDADNHWALVRAVTGIEVNAHSPDAVKQTARSAFVHAWNYDIVPANLIGLEELEEKRTYMGHAEYAAEGLDFDTRMECPFKDPEEVFSLDPWEIYGTKDKQELIQRFNLQYRTQCQFYPDAVNMTGIYVTLFSGLITILGWEMLLTTLGTDPRRFGEVMNRYAQWMQQYYDALACCEAPVLWTHDDMVWASGAIFHPEWYRKYIFPNYKKYYAPLLEAGKKVIFVSDGNYTRFVDDIAAAGASGFFFEPLTNLKYVVEHYGKSHVIIGNVDTRILLSGSREDIRKEVERCMALGKSCPGYFMSVTNMIPVNTPVDNALFYNEIYESLSRR